MSRPAKKPALWAVVALIVLATFALTTGILQFATSTPAELQQMSTGRSLKLPGWGWASLGIALGVSLFAYAAWSLYWRRRW